MIRLSCFTHSLRKDGLVEVKVLWNVGNWCWKQNICEGTRMFRSISMKLKPRQNSKLKISRSEIYMKPSNYLKVFSILPQTSRYSSELLKMFTQHKSHSFISLEPFVSAFKFALIFLQVLFQLLRSSIRYRQRREIFIN